VDYLSAPDPGSHIDPLARLVQWRSLFPGLVGPMLVVMPRVLGQDLPEVSFAVDKQYQASVPGEQCAGRHDPVQPKVPGQEPRERGDHSTVSPVRFRLGDAAAQDRDLVPQHQDLYVLRSVAARKQR
jgi:hypothetical protein